MLTFVRSLGHRFGSAIALAGLCAMPAVLHCDAHAQALSTAGHSAAIYVFGGLAFEQPDYGPDQYKNWGWTAGANYDRYFRLGKYPVGAGLEGRISSTTGTIVNEKTYGGGLRISTTIYDRFHPFLNGIAGLGTIKYNILPIASDPSYDHDNGWILQYGFGLDIDVYRNWAIKLDGQQQNWNLGHNYTLGPAVYSASIVYRIPFRSYIGMNSHHKEKNLPPRPPAAAPTPVSITTTTDTSTTTTTTPAPDTTSAPATAPDTTAAPATTAPGDNMTPSTTAPADTTAPSNTTPPPPPATGTSNPQ